MTISSSLNAGVAGLSSNATRLAAISDNIANSATAGYKRTSTDFHSLVIQNASRSVYSAGGVTSTSTRLVDQRGALSRTDNGTDLSINGRGFLPVTDLTSLKATGSPTSLALITTGSFRMDENGWLRTSAGHVLLGWPAASDGTVSVMPRDTLTGLQPIRINMDQISANPTTQAKVAINLPATDTRSTASGAPREMVMEYFNNLGESRELSFSFTPVIPATGSSNSWRLDIHDSYTGMLAGSHELTFSDQSGTAGTLAQVNSLSGGAYDPATGRFQLQLPHGTVEIEIGRPGMANGLTQLAADYVPSAPVKDGSPASSMVGLEVDSSGNLHGLYDQGFSRLLYQIPVADVRNPNGLTAIGNQAYQVSNASGSFYLWDAGTGPTGQVEAFSREESTTDIANELTQLIQTQRAYSTNAKVIQTVDEMLQETTNLKR